MESGDSEADELEKTPQTKKSKKLTTKSRKSTKPKTSSKRKTTRKTSSKNTQQSLASSVTKPSRSKKESLASTSSSSSKTRSPRKRVVNNGKLELKDQIGDTIDWLMETTGSNISKKEEEKITPRRRNSRSDQKKS